MGESRSCPATVAMSFCFFPESDRFRIAAQAFDISHYIIIRASPSLTVILSILCCSSSIVVASKYHLPHSLAIIFIRHLIEDPSWLSVNKSKKAAPAAINILFASSLRCRVAHESAEDNKTTIEMFWQRQ